MAALLLATVLLPQLLLLSQLLCGFDSAAATAVLLQLQALQLQHHF
jgi:hypothetical protein